MSYIYLPTSTKPITTNCILHIHHQIMLASHQSSVILCGFPLYDVCKCEALLKSVFCQVQFGNCWNERLSVVASPRSSDIVVAFSSMELFCFGWCFVLYSLSLYTLYIVSSKLYPIGVCEGVTELSIVVFCAYFGSRGWLL